MIDIDIEKQISQMDGRRFSILASKEENDRFYSAMDELVSSPTDKYPKTFQNILDLGKAHVSRKISKFTNSNIVRVFDDKKSSKIVAQYSYNPKGILPQEDIKAIREEECTVYLLCHTDMDGDASGSLVFNTLHYGDNVKILRFNYEYKVLDELILNVEIDKAKHPKKKFVLFIVDLSPKILYMTMLLSTFNKVVWIDHHAGSLPTVNEIESGDYLESVKHAFVTSDFSYILDTRLSATQLTLLWMKPYISQIKKTKEIEGYTLASLITVYDLKKDTLYPEAYQKSLYMNQFYWDYQTLYVFTSFWKDSFMRDYEIESITRMFTSGKYLWELNQKKLKMLYMFDYKYRYVIDFHNGKTLTIRAIYGTGNNSRFMERTKHGEDDYEITLLIRYTATPVILSVTGYTSDEIIKDMGINEVFGWFGLGQGHPGAAGMRISRHDMLKLGMRSLFAVADTDQIPYFDPDENDFDNPKIQTGLNKLHVSNLDTTLFLCDFKKQIAEQYNKEYGIHNIRFEPEIDVLVRTFTLIFASFLYNKLQTP